VVLIQFFYIVILTFCLGFLFAWVFLSVFFFFFFFQKQGPQNVYQEKDRPFVCAFCFEAKHVPHAGKLTYLFESYGTCPENQSGQSNTERSTKMQEVGFIAIYEAI